MINGNNLKRGKQTYLRTTLSRKANYCVNPLKNCNVHSITGLIQCTKQSTALQYLAETVKRYRKQHSCPLAQLHSNQMCILLGKDAEALILQMCFSEHQELLSSSFVSGSDSALLLTSHFMALLQFNQLYMEIVLLTYLKRSLGFLTT